MELFFWDLMSYVFVQRGHHKPELSFPCTVQKSWDLNGQSLVCTFLVDDSDGHQIFSASCAELESTAGTKGVRLQCYCVHVS